MIYNIEVKRDILNIFLHNKKYNNKEIKIIVKSFDDVLLHQNKAIITKDIYFWHKHLIPYTNYTGIIVEIYYKTNLIQEEKIRFKDNSGNPIKKQVLHINNVGGMGDQFSSEPLIRKISESFQQKIIVVTIFPDLFINHPCIETIINSTDVPNEYKTDEYNIHYTLRWNDNTHGYNTRWPTIDFRQMMSYQLGFMLTPDEMQYHFYANDFEEIDELPEKYILINPSITGADRVWSTNNWQKLINLLNENNINVVSIGKKANYNGKDLDYMELKIEKGIDLSGKECQSNLSQVWHLINKSSVFVTMDNGLFIFAGSTDAHILQLGSPINPHYHKPYRYGSQNYKYSYVVGECPLHCISDLKYGVRETGKLENNLIQYCYKKYPEYKCHPTPEKAFEEILKIIQSDNVK